MVLVLLMPIIIGFVAANPFPDILDNRLVSQVQKAFSLSAKDPFDTIDGSDKINEIVENINKTLSSLKHPTNRLKDSDSETRDNESNERRTTQQERKRKAIIVDYPLIPRVLHYPKVPTYEVDYDDNSEVVARDGSRELKKSQESNIFYIRLPPTPYMFVPGLGYISQPPMYSPSGLKPQIPLVSQLLQLPHVKPLQPQLVSEHTVNSFIKLPINFVSNGKPTSVYQWQKKSGKKPADSPITNLSAGFVSNGKPTSIYQWQANLKPIKRPDDSLNSLDVGPYTFNGKLTGVYLLGSNGSPSMYQPIRYPNYQDDYQNAYY